MIPVFRTPILILAWRRPDCLRRLIRVVRIVKPKYLYAAVDGPRPNNGKEKEKIKECIRILTTEVDWECRLRLLSSAKNLGCRDGVRRGLDWFFSNVKEGIVLEDDCIPHHDFFAYCETLLNYYRNDPKVVFISGDNSHGIESGFADSSYTFIRTPLVWGWASWSSHWMSHDRDMTIWENYSKLGHRPTLFYSEDEHKHMCSIFDQICYYGVPNTWDYQYAASILVNHQLCIVPRSNLVSNVGFGDDATHTKGGNRRANSMTHPVFPIRHPEAIELDVIADRQVFTRVHCS